MATNVTEKDKTLNDVIEWCGEQVSGIEKKIPTASDADFLNGERCTLLADAKDDGWQILYKDEHPELERDMHYCPAHRLPECSTCTNIMIDPAGWKDGQCPECIKEEIPNERS